MANCKACGRPAQAARGGHLDCLEDIAAEICDHYCKWPSEYKDSDDLWNDKCDDCPIRAFLDEVSTCLKQGSAGT